MSILCVFLYFLMANAASREVRNGFPKFPQNTCGFRSVSWNPHREAKVVGGEVPPLGAVPWQIEIRYFDGKHQCGGALISTRLVLTAAHCFDDELRAVAGAYGPPGEADLIESIYKNPTVSIKTR